MTWTLESGRPLISHPAQNGKDQKALWDHLSNVSDRAANVTQGELAHVERLLGLAHDFPKATPAFQQHVRDESVDDPKHHARLAALVAYFLLEQNDYGREIRLAGMIAVAKHHGNVPDVATYIRKAFKNPRIDGNDSDTTIQAINQVNEIESHASPFARHVFKKAVGDGAWTIFLERIGSPSDSPLLDQIVEDAGEHGGFGGVNVDPEHFSASFYTTFLALFGGLTLADKTDAAGISDDDRRLQGETPDFGDLETHLSDLGGDEQNEIEANLNAVRARIQETIPERTAAFLASDRDVATLTLPTGYGKTLAGLLAGLEIAEQQGGRVIYALPFTSIIDQTAGTLQEIFDADPAGNLLTVHHHLAETRTVEEAQEDIETDEHASHDVLLAESWRTGITLTTFVQLFESIAGPTNGQSLKLPSLQGSTIIIDEPQAIPQHWWPLARRLLGFLTEELDARVILMTATQPTLVEEPKSFELISREALTGIKQDAFGGSFPSRVTYRFHDTALATTNEDRLEYDEAATHLTETVQRNYSVLAICNTIGSTQTLTEAFIESLSQSGDEPISVAKRYNSYLDDRDTIGGIKLTVNGDGHRPSRDRARLVREITTATSKQNSQAYLHLSTRVRPCDRQFLLAVANDLAGQEIPFILISTQLVEAGVDISFDTVFRDFAPLDSIVQAAGRCNRSYERAPETGETTIWQLKPSGEGSVPPSTAVYAPNRERGETGLLRHTRDVLETIQSEYGDTVPDEILASDAVESYHEIVGERVHSVAENNELVTAFEQADGDKLRRASLIDRRESVEVYVCRTDSELEKATAIHDLVDSHQFDKVETIRNELASIRVSIPVPRAQSDAASGLFSLETLVGEDDDPERILDVPNSMFDSEFGVQLSEYSVEDRFF